MPEPIPSFANYGAEYSTKFDAALLNAPLSVMTAVKALTIHMGWRDGQLKSKSERKEKRRKQIEEERANRDRIAADESKNGPLKHVRVLPDGKQELVPVDRLGPIDAKIKRMRSEDAEEDAIKIPYAPGVPFAWIANTRALIPVEIPEVKSPTEAEQKKAFARSNAKLAKVEEVQNAPRPSHVAEANIDAELDRMAARGEPRIGSHLKGGRYSERNGTFQIEVPYASINWPEKRVRNEFEASFGVVDDAMALVVWAFKDEIRDKLHKLVAARSRDDVAMTVEEKRVALAEAQASAVEALRYEVAVNFAVEAATGHIVEWRRKIHPAILLGVEIDPAVALAWQGD